MFKQKKNEAFLNLTFCVLNPVENDVVFVEHV